MGLYDWIDEDMWCPYCGVKIPKGSFQTKSFGSTFTGKHLVRPLEMCRGSIHTIYHSCPSCRSRIELMVGEDSVR